MNAIPTPAAPRPSASKQPASPCSGQLSPIPSASSPESTYGAPALWWIVAGTAFIAAAAYFAHRRSGLGWLLALSAFLAGALHIQLRDASTRLDTTIQLYADHQELQVTAHVTRDGRLQQGGFNEIRQTVDVESESIQTATGQSEAIHSGLRLGIYIPRPNDATPEETSEAHAPTAAIPVFHYGGAPMRRSRIRRSCGRGGATSMPRNSRPAWPRKVDADVLRR